MMTDIATMIWKELRELLRQRGSKRSTLLGILIPIALLGIYLPYQSGREWVESPVSLAAWAWVPLVFITSVIADSFAGERERHTLETLLASRLPDHAILFGKILAAMLYALVITLFMVFVGLVTVNVTAKAERLLLFPLHVTLIGLALTIIFGLLMATIGVFVSLRAATVRQAQQSLSYATLVLVFLPMIALRIVPQSWIVQVSQTLQNVGGSLIAAIILLTLLLADVVLIILAMHRFQRARLIL
jgi:ABC-2 type transport system permease protein